MRIDAHQHFWIYDPLRDAWITEAMKKIQRDFLPKDLLPILKENAIDGCIAVQADASEKETKFLLETASHTNAVKGVVGWIDLRADNAAARLAHYAQFKLMKGFRHIVQAEPDDNFLLDKNFCRGIALLSQYNFTYDILIYPRQLPAAIRFAEKFPDQKFVIDHLAKPLIAAKQIDKWANDMEQIAQFENVFCKLSGMVTEADWKNWTYNDMAPYIEVVVECFGTDRLMYGSDWPVCQVAGSYKDQLSILEKYFRTFLIRDQEAIFGKNAARFYNLEEI